MDRFICIHGHFYQPPRENPWLEEVELQDSAYPYHDWNERITAECYSPNTASHILDSHGCVMYIINNYSKMSFNFGPTLLCWLEKHRSVVYNAVLEADKLSVERFSGHGSALAQVYNHMIMPLANKRDKYTQVIWGIKDFQKRFGRFPEGMWLPETAVDLETLEVLADLGIKFSILAPYQAKNVRKLNAKEWKDISGGKIDPSMPYLCTLPSGKTISLFFYDGVISHDVAFGGLLNNGEEFAKRLQGAFNDQRDWPQIVHIATDGETFGHHHHRGDMALAYCLYFIETNNTAKLTNYGEYLAKHPPTHEVTIVENSSWSCIHGIERWKNNCGCHSGMHPGWTQAWRQPLREAMDGLRDKLVPLYEEEASKYLKDPWSARNDYIDVVLDRSKENMEAFFGKYAVKELSTDEKVRTLKLLEVQRNTLLMYTSCGWFFDEISGIESVQVMQYAANAMRYLEEVKGLSLESEYLKTLAKAPSNVFGDGTKPYEMFVKPSRVDHIRVGAHYGISSIFEKYPEHVRIFCYTAKSEIYEKLEAGKLRLALGKATITSDITCEEQIISFAVLFLGDHTLNGGVRQFLGEEAFSTMQIEIKATFDKADVPELIRLMDKHFGVHNYSLWHLFRDEQRNILNQILQSTYESIEGSYREIYENNYNLMNFLQNLGIPLPKPLYIVAEYVLNQDLKRILVPEDINLEKLRNLMNEIKKWSITIDTATIRFASESCINPLMEKLSQQPEDLTLFDKIETVLQLLTSLPIKLELWEAQNTYYTITKNLYGAMKDRAENGEEFARKWLEGFHKLGDYMCIRVT